MHTLALAIHARYNVLGGMDGKIQFSVHQIQVTLGARENHSLAALGGVLGAQEQLALRLVDHCLVDCTDFVQS